MHRESRSPRSLIQVKEVSWGARARLLFPGERKHLIPEKLLLRGRAFPWSVGFAPFLRAYNDRSTFPGSVGDAMQFHRHFTDLRVSCPMEVSREDEFPADLLVSYGIYWPPTISYIFQRPQTYWSPTISYN